MSNPTPRTHSSLAPNVGSTPELKAFPGTRQTSCREAALALLEAGFWPVALRTPGEPKTDGKPSDGKDPRGSGWGAKRRSRGELERTYKQHPGSGVGICLGPDRLGAGLWLIDIEGDGDQAEESYTRLVDGEVIETGS